MEESANLQNKSVSYFQVLHYSQGVAAAGSPACLIWQIFSLAAFTDATPKRFVSPP